MNSQTSHSNLFFVILDLPAMPRNRSHQVVRNMLIKTPLAREFEKDLRTRLHGYRKAFEGFQKGFNPLKHYVVATFNIFTPRENLFTKAGYISQHATDFDAHKLFVDVVFDCIGLNDKVIRDGRIFTPVSHDGNWNYTVTLRLEDLKELENPCHRNTHLPILSLDPSANLL